MEQNIFPRERIGFFTFDLGKNAGLWSSAMLDYAEKFNIAPREQKLFAYQRGLEHWNKRPIAVKPETPEFIKVIADGETERFLQMLFQDYLDSSNYKYAYNIDLGSLLFNTCTDQNCDCNPAMQQQLVRVSSKSFYRGTGEKFDFYSTECQIGACCLRLGYWRPPTFEECILWGFKWLWDNKDKIGDMSSWLQKYAAE